MEVVPALRDSRTEMSSHAWQSRGLVHQVGQLPSCEIRGLFNPTCEQQTAEETLKLGFSIGNL